MIKRRSGSATPPFQGTVTKDRSPPTVIPQPSNIPNPDGISISVCVRIRPPPADGLTDKQRPRNHFGCEIYRNDGSVSWKWSDKRIIYQEPHEKEFYYGHQAQQYVFSHVYNMNVETMQVYLDVGRPIVQRTFEGYNCCIFAYGQTNSGKTYTISGAPDSPGIISLAVKDFFEYIACSTDRRSLLRVAFLEIYNEQLKDLLTDKPASLTIKEDPDRGCPVVVNQTEKVVSSLEEVIQLAIAGEKRRVFGCNNVHEHASRSHTVFQLIFESRHKDETQVRISTLSIVDLAGSELAFTHLDPINIEATVTPATEHKVREREGANIRKSLLALSRVVEALARSPNEHIPYRDSKLTRILQSALGGNTNTAMIATINPWMSAVDDRQTNATLRFAMTAQKVDNHPKRVNLISQDQALLDQYEEELRELRMRMQDHDESLEERETVIRRLNEEKTSIKTDYEKQLQFQAVEGEKLRQQFQNLSKFILTSHSLQGQDLVSAVQGIGIDEEGLRLGRKSKKRSSHKESKSQTKPRRRRASFCCLRDKDSKSLFGLVDKAALLGRVSQTAPDEFLTLPPSKETKEFHESLDKQLVVAQKNKIDGLQAELNEREAENQVLREMLQRALARQFMDHRQTIHSWRKLMDSLSTEQKNEKKHQSGNDENDYETDEETQEVLDKFTDVEKLLSTKVKKNSEEDDNEDDIMQRQLEILEQSGDKLKMAQQDALDSHSKVTLFLHETRNKVIELQLECRKLNQRIQDLESDGARLRTNVSDRDASIRTAEAEIASQKQIVQTTQAKVEQLTKELHDKTNDMNALQAQYDTLIAEKGAFETYYKYKKEHRKLKPIREVFEHPKPPDYKPWHKFLTTDQTTPRTEPRTTPRVDNTQHNPA